MADNTISEKQDILRSSPLRGTNPAQKGAKTDEAETGQNVVPSEEERSSKKNAFIHNKITECTMLFHQVNDAEAVKESCTWWYAFRR